VIGVLPREFLFPGQEAVLAIPLQPRSPAWRSRNEFSPYVREAARECDASDAGGRAWNDRARAAREVSRGERQEGPSRVCSRWKRSSSERSGRCCSSCSAPSPCLLALRASTSLAFSSFAAWSVAVNTPCAWRWARRATLVRLTFLEAARLSCVAGAGAVVLAWLALRVVRRGMVVSLPQLPEVGLDIVTLVIVAAVAAVCVIAVAIGPAWRISRVDLEPLLRGHGRTACARRLGRITNGLVVAQLSVAIVLVVISAGLVSSVRALAAGGPGFDAAREREVRVSLPPSTYKTLPAVESFYQQAGRPRRCLALKT
jgi:hypothetical protein